MHRVTALVFEEFQVLDLMGPMEFLGNLPGDFSIRVVSEEGGQVASHAGVQVVAEGNFGEAAGDTDILLIPGGGGTRREVRNPRLLDWIGEAAEQAGRVLTVCTGAALLAQTGLLDGRRATTNKRAFDWVAQQRPQVDWQKRARWVEDGKFFTSSGVSAGMDLTLAVIADILGKAKAAEVAMWAEYTWNDDPDNDPFAIA